eukprot:2229210-Pleurochrysis_carterae.AAC.1
MPMRSTVLVKSAPRLLGGRLIENILLPFYPMQTYLNEALLRCAEACRRVTASESHSLGESHCKSLELGEARSGRNIAGRSTRRSRTARTR